MGEHRVVRAGGLHSEERAVDRLGDDLALVEAAHQIDVGQVLVQREEGERGEERAARGARGGGLGEGEGELARAVPLLAPVPQAREVGAHVARRRVEDLEPELLEVVLGVPEAAGHGEMRDVGDRVAGGQERRVLAGRPGLLQDDPPLVGLGVTARVPPGLLDQELREHLRPARVLGFLGTPRVEPSGSEPRGLSELQGGGAGDRLHTLPALLALPARAGEELLGGGEVLVALDHRHHVQQVLVGAGEPHVQVLLAHEPVIRRVRGVR